MACRLFGAKPLPEPMLTLNQTTKNRLQENSNQNTKVFVEENIFENVINPLRSRQNGRHFADDIFKCIFLNVKILLKFVPNVTINNIPALV